ncbi:MAG: porin [Campylobacterota bacterium]|nr:porin [Campylobacterota bacterium]
MKKMIKLSLVAATVLGLATTSYAESKVTVSGDAEVTYENLTQNDTTDVYKTADVNINIDAVNEDGVEFHSQFVLYDGTQGDITGLENGVVTDTTGNPEAYSQIERAYVVAPLPFAEAKLTAGLAPNGAFGSGMFENGGESWKTDLTMKAAGLKVKVGNVTIKESNASQADKIKNYVKVEGSAGDIKYGLQYSNTKDTATDCTKTYMNPYVTASVAGLDIAAEYASWGSDGDGTGMFVQAGKEMGPLSVALAYVTLSGADGSAGGDYAASDFFDGNVASNATDDTSAIVVPVSYKVSDKLTAGLTYVSADVTGLDGTAMDITADYALGKSTSIGLLYATATGDAVGADDYTKMAMSVSMSF